MMMSIQTPDCCQAQGDDAVSHTALEISKKSQSSYPFISHSPSQTLRGRVLDQISVGLFVQTLVCNNIFTFALLSPVFLEGLVGALTQKFRVNSTLSPLISSRWHATATQLVQDNTFNKGSPFLTSSSLPQAFPPTQLRCHKTFERHAIRAAPLRDSHQRVRPRPGLREMTDPAYHFPTALLIQRMMWRCVHQRSLIPEARGHSKQSSTGRGAKTVWKD